PAVAKRLTELTGQQWRHEPLTFETYGAKLEENFSSDTAEAFIGLCQSLDAGRFSAVADTVHRLTGRDAKRIDDILRDQLAASAR
ncbi:MAG: hypothetical protein AAFN74_13810, partial [Myxococcota bacterium]